MSLVTLIWLCCRIGKSIFSKQKYQLSSHFYLQSHCEHIDSWNNQIVKLIERILTMQKRNKSEQYWRWYLSLKVLRVSSCQDSKSLLLNSITFTNWQFRFSIGAYAKTISRNFFKKIQGLLVRNIWQHLSDLSQSYRLRKAETAGGGGKFKNFDAKNSLALCTSVMEGLVFRSLVMSQSLGIPCFDKLSENTAMAY